MQKKQTFIKMIVFFKLYKIIIWENCFRPWLPQTWKTV